MAMKGIVLECEEECSFKLADGRTIRSLMELNRSFDNMDDGVFQHHVNNERNDFSDWIKNVLKDEKLAEDLSKTQDKTMSQLLVIKRVIDFIA